MNTTNAAKSPTPSPVRRDWAGRTISDAPISYINRTGRDVDFLHAAVMGAIANGGALPEEIADLFTLTRPAGVWILDFA